MECTRLAEHQRCPTIQVDICTTHVDYGVNLDWCCITLAILLVLFSQTPPWDGWAEIFSLWVVIIWIVGDIFIFLTFTLKVQLTDKQISKPNKFV